jgi:hypothetical protein
MGSSAASPTAPTVSAPTARRRLPCYAGLCQGGHEAENLGSTYNATVIGESPFDAENAAFRV